MDLSMCAGSQQPVPVLLTLKYNSALHSRGEFHVQDYPQQPLGCRHCKKRLRYVDCNK